MPLGSLLSPGGAAFKDTEGLTLLSLVLVEFSGDNVGVRGVPQPKLKGHKQEQNPGMGQPWLSPEA